MVMASACVPFRPGTPLAVNCLWPNADDHVAMPFLSIWKERLGWRLTKICAKPTVKATVYRLLMHEKPLILPSEIRLFVL